MSLANLSYAVSFTPSLMLSVLLYFDYHSFDYYYLITTALLFELVTFKAYLEMYVDYSAANR